MNSLVIISLCLVTATALIVAVIGVIWSYRDGQTNALESAAAHQAADMKAAKQIDDAPAQKPDETFARD